MTEAVADESLEETTDESPQAPPEETTEEAFEKHWIQVFYDNPWILLILGILIPFLSYTVWGWIDLASIPPAELP